MFYNAFPKFKPNFKLNFLKPTIRHRDSLMRVHFSFCLVGMKKSKIYEFFYFNY